MSELRVAEPPELSQTRLLQDFFKDSWRDEALCIGKEVFQVLIDEGIKNDNPLIKEAKKICSPCPVKEDCKKEGLSVADPDIRGVRGGLSATELRRIKRKEKIPTARRIRNRAK